MLTASNTVLIVDDEAMIRANLERLLKPNGYYTVAAASGDEALEILASQEIGIVLLDIRMPGISGLEVLSHLHKNYPDIAVIMATAMSDVTTAVDAMKAGAYDFITKPFNLDDVILRVAKAREKRSMSLLLKGHQRELEARLAQQAKEIQALTMQTIQALVKEETLKFELEARGGKHKGLPQGTDIKEFGAKILRRMSGPTD